MKTNIISSILYYIIPTFSRMLECLYSVFIVKRLCFGLGLFFSPPEFQVRVLILKLNYGKDLPVWPFITIYGFCDVGEICSVNV